MLEPLLTANFLILLCNNSLTIYPAVKYFVLLLWSKWFTIHCGIRTQELLCIDNGQAVSRQANSFYFWYKQLWLMTYVSSNKYVGLFWLEFFFPIYYCIFRKKSKTIVVWYFTFEFHFLTSLSEPRNLHFSLKWNSN